MITADFTNKIVFITGAASGIGAAQAKKFLTANAFFFAFDIQSIDSSAFSTEFPGHFACFTGDIKNETHLKAAIDHCHQTFGTIDILLNTAGILDDYLTLAETDETLWERVLNTNLKGMFLLTKLLLPELLANKGTVINMASIAGLVAGGGGIAYTSHYWFYKTTSAGLC